MPTKDQDMLWNEFWYNIGVITLQLVVGSYFFLSLLERLFTGFVSYVFNQTILLIVILVATIFTLLVRELPRLSLGTAHRQRPFVRKLAMLNLTVLPAIVVSGLLYYQLRGFGRIGLVVALLGGILTMFLSLHFVLESEAPDGDQQARPPTP